MSLAHGHRRTTQCKNSDQQVNIKAFEMLPVAIFVVHAATEKDNKNRACPVTTTTPRSLQPRIHAWMQHLLLLPMSTSHTSSRCRHHIHPPSADITYILPLPTSHTSSLGRQHIHPPSVDITSSLCRHHSRHHTLQRFSIHLPTRCTHTHTCAFQSTVVATTQTLKRAAGLSSTATKDEQRTNDERRTTNDERRFFVSMNERLKVSNVRSLKV